MKKTTCGIYPVFWLMLDAAAESQIKMKTWAPRGPLVSHRISHGDRSAHTVGHI